MSRLPNGLQKLIPLDKAWMIRMGMLDLAAGQTGVRGYLEEHKAELGDDLHALLGILEQWGSGEPLDVGESGTLYRIVRFLSWLQQSEQEIVTRGTLRKRSLTDDSTIVELPLTDLMKLDSGTSQWASAKVLFTDTTTEGLEYVPYHLQMSLKAKQQYKQGWKPRKDQTIQRQAEAYVDWRQTGKSSFTPRQAEDFPFAVAFDVLTIGDGERLWPQLRNHETDRIAEMKRLLNVNTIDSPDHRVVQALAMRYPNRKVTDVARKAVNKTWPQFWTFLHAANAT